eukprot:Skav216860  [mRNA]  locus=scaffold1042:196118:196597:- [translate_table: standard]
MASLSSVALSLAMAAIVSLVLALMVAPVAGQFSPPAQPQVPPCRAPSTTQSAALQDAVEGIAGLMQRFEDLQPQIAQLPATELQQIAQPAQKLHERFENMQKKLVALGSGNAGPELEEAAGLVEWYPSTIAGVQSALLAVRWFFFIICRSFHLPHRRHL